LNAVLPSSCDIFFINLFVCLESGDHFEFECSCQNFITLLMKGDISIYYLIKIRCFQDGHFIRILASGSVSAYKCQFSTKNILLK
jgi:hypothetical protein